MSLLLQSKGIAGRIIPAIATTTSVIVGLVCLELYKVVQGFTNLQAYKNGFINLALPFFAFSEPLPPVKHYFQGKRWTLWDRHIVENQPTLIEFLDDFKKRFGLDVTMITSGVLILFSDLLPNPKLEQRKSMKLNEIYESISEQKLSPSRKLLELEISLENKETGEDDFEFPTVHYLLSSDNSPAMEP